MYSDLTFLSIESDSNNYYLFVACHIWHHDGMQLSYSLKLHGAESGGVWVCGGKSRDLFVKYDKYRVFLASIFTSIIAIISIITRS